MVLRIYIVKKDFCFEATNRFQVSGVVDYDKLDNLLARIKMWVSDTKNYFALLDRDGIASFKIKDTPNKYEFELVGDSDCLVPTDVAVSSVENLSKLTVNEIIVKCRKYDIYKPRILMFSALRFFSKMSTPAIEVMTGFDHASVLHTGKAISQFYNLNDDFIKNGVESLAVEFNNVGFYDAVRNNKYPR